MDICSFHFLGSSTEDATCPGQPHPTSKANVPATDLLVTVTVLGLSKDLWCAATNTFHKSIQCKRVACV
jgi:hypothetical protein